MAQWIEKLLTSGSLVTSIQDDTLKLQIRRIIFLNEMPIDWAYQGITQNTATGTLDFTAVGGFQGRLVYEYKQVSSAGTGVVTQTNGYNIDDVLPMLRRIGWINPTKTGYNIVDSDNQASLCNRWYNDNSFHAFCNIEYLYDTQPDETISDAEFNDYLELQRDSIISKSLNAVFDTPQFVESGMLYDKVDNSELSTVANEGKFVGIRFKLSKKDYFMNILTATLFFDGNVSFTLYLYNEFIGKVEEWNVSALANKQVVVQIFEAIQYCSDTVKGGNWFLGYFQDDLGSVKALKYTECWHEFKTFDATSISSEVTGVETFNMQNYSYTYDGFGLNAEISVDIDQTQLIRRNRHLFDNLQGLMMAANVMDIVINSTRSNRSERIGDDKVNMMYRELNNVTTDENPTESGLKSKIRSEIKRVRQAFYPKQGSKVVSLC